MRETHPPHRLYFTCRTWARRCDRAVFVLAGSAPVDRSNYSFPIAYVGDERIEKYEHLPEKTLLALLHVYQNHGDAYDWFFKGDDDTFVIIENLRHFLRRQHSNSSIYYGYVAQTPNRFYPSGGAGYVLSRQALKQFAEQILTKPEERQSCKYDIAEDVNLAYCLARIGVFVMNARDDKQLETFHPMTFEQHFMGKFTRWIENNAQFPQEKGEKCCSPLTISFHAMSIDDMRMLHFLLYRIRKASV